MAGRIPPNRPNPPKIKTTPEENKASDKKTAKSGTPGSSTPSTPSSEPGSPASPAMSPRTKAVVERWRAIRDDAIETFGGSPNTPSHSSGGIQNGNSVLRRLSPERSLSDINPQPGAPMGGLTSAGPHSAPTSPRGGFQMGSDSPGTLLRSDSSSSFGSAYSDGYHLPSTGADSPLPRDISRSSSGLSNLVEVPIMGAGFDWPGKRPGPMNFDHSLLNTPANSNPNSPRGSEPKSPHGSEPSTSGSSGLSRSESEFSLNTGNLINGEREREAMNGITHTPGKHVLHTTVNLNQEDLAKGHKNVDEVIPAHYEPGSSHYPIASTLSNYPGGRQAAREIPNSVIEARWGGTTPEQTNGQVPSRSSSMESELRKPLPETNWDFTKNAAAPTGEGATGEAAATKKKPALSKLQMAGLGTLAVGGAAAAILPIVLGSKDDSSNGDGSVQT